MSWFLQGAVEFVQMYIILDELSAATIWQGHIEYTR